MLRNIIFGLDFCYFKDISDKVTADDEVIMHDDVTCMMTSCLIYWLIIICTFLLLRCSIFHKILEYCSIIFILSFNS